MCIRDSPKVGPIGGANEVSAPEGIRTPNLLIRSQMLYPLSYGRLLRAERNDVTCYRPGWCGANLQVDTTMPTYGDPPRSGRHPQTSAKMLVTSRAGTHTERGARPRPAGAERSDRGIDAMTSTCLLYTSRCV